MDDIKQSIISVLVSIILVVTIIIPLVYLSNDSLSPVEIGLLAIVPIFLILGIIFKLGKRSI